MNKTKIFAAYLPQFHETEENNIFWGKGYTDWVAVKNSKPLFDGHAQPRVPLNKKYYDLSLKEDISTQCELAKQYEISGFNIYHYWFKNGKQALQKPAEIILNNPEIDIEYFFTWDTNSWVRSWSGVSGNSWTTKYEKTEKDKKDILIEFEYGNKEDWKKHFDYLIEFFKDKRYYKINGKPVFIFFSTYKIEIEEMSKYWEELAITAGLPGLYIVTQAGSLVRNKMINAEFIYEPSFSVWSKKDGIMRLIKKIIPIKEEKKLKIYSYKKAWENVLKDNKKMLKRSVVPGAFVGYDDSPRRAKDARIILGKSSKDELSHFEKYFKELYSMCCKNNKDFMLLTAWNEWGEGAYLEPDENNGYAYLEIIKRTVKLCSE